jgi:hypothetical protein
VRGNQQVEEREKRAIEGNNMIRAHFMQYVKVTNEPILKFCKKV